MAAALATCALSTRVRAGTDAYARSAADAEAALEEAREEALPSGGALAAFEPIGGARSLALSLDVAAGRRLSGQGARAVWFVGIVVAIPLDRLFGAGRPPKPIVIGDGFPRGLAAHPEETMLDKRKWGAALALPGALALAPAARGGPNAGGKIGTTSASNLAGASSSSSARGVAGMPSAPRLAPSVLAAARASASPSTTPVASTSASASAVLAAPGASIPPGALRAVVRAAWHEAGLDGDDRLDELSGRARSAAWAPELRIRAYRGTSAGASVYGAVDAADRSTLSDGVTTLVETRLIWRLDRIVFADEEVAIERIRLERAELRQRLAARVIELALAWLRACRAAEEPALLEPDRELARATATEALLALDALSGGAASKLLSAGTGH
jgi:hypothetical protein